MSKQLDYQIKETSFFQILWLSKSLIIKLRISSIKSINTSQKSW